MFFAFKKNMLLKFQSPDKAYDGDEENTTGGSDSSSMVSSKSKSSLYDFDEEDPEPTKSPHKKQRAKKKKLPMTSVPVPSSGGKSKSTKEKCAASTTKTTDYKANVPKKPKYKKVLATVTQLSPMDVSPLPQSNNTESPMSTRSTMKGKNVSFSPNVSEIIPAKFTPVVTLQRLDVCSIESSQRQLRKRSWEPPVGTVKSPKIKKSNPVLKVKSLKKEKSRDSGIYCSPEVVTEKNFKAQAVSTPCNLSSAPVETSLTTYRDPAILNVSPVKKLSIGSVTPLSDYASMDSITHQLTFNDSAVTDTDKSQTQGIELFTTGGGIGQVFKFNKQNQTNLSRRWIFWGGGIIKFSVVIEIQICPYFKTIRVVARNY